MKPVSASCVDEQTYSMSRVGLKEHAAVEPLTSACALAKGRRF